MSLNLKIFYSTQVDRVIRKAVTSSLRIDTGMDKPIDKPINVQLETPDENSFGLKDKFLFDLPDGENAAAYL